MNCRVNNQTGKKSGLITALIFLFVNTAIAQSSFPINDPRNPDCPCHKYQKLADEEYKKLLAQNNVLNNEKSTSVKTSVDAKGISDDELGKINKVIKPNDDQKFGGISTDELAKINLNKGDNVLGKINEAHGELKISDQRKDRSGSNSIGSHSKTTKHWKGKRKKHNAYYKQLKRIFYVGGWDIWKRKKITSACYHWK